MAILFWSLFIRELGVPRVAGRQLHWIFCEKTASLKLLTIR